MYISLKPGYDDPAAVEAQVTAAIRQIIGPIARPAHVWVTNDLPKTRSGKIMRRVIASISNFMDIGDTTTLANPEVVEEIRVQVQTVKVREGQVPEGLSPEMAEEVRRFGAED
jgi:acetyl-CoA synthetase